MKKKLKPLCTVKAAFVLPVIFSFFITSFTFVSCKENEDVVTYDIFTLREDAKILEETTDWVMEIEGEVLTRRIDRMDGIDTSRTLLNIGSVIANKKNNGEEKVYPYLKGFSSLDLTSFSSSSDQKPRKLAEDFCKAFCEKKNLDEFFDSDSLFSLVSFIDDLNKKCSVKYFDVASEKNENIDGTKEPGKEVKKSEAPVFSSKIGSPVINEKYCFVPVRFTGKNKMFDAELCLEKKENWKITEISLKKWENKVK